jgi:plastocyanin
VNPPPDSRPSSTPRGAGTRWRWLAGVAAVVTVGCGAFAIAAAVTSDDDDAGASTQECAADATQQVRIADFAFEPPELSVSAGSCITWTNEDGTTHTVRDSAGGVINSANLGQGDTYRATFDDPGTYDYICSIHTNMSGTVTVTE